MTVRPTSPVRPLAGPRVVARASAPAPAAQAQAPAKPQPQAAPPKKKWDENPVVAATAAGGIVAGMLGAFMAPFVYPTLTFPFLAMVGIAVAIGAGTGFAASKVSEAFPNAAKGNFFERHRSTVTGFATAGAGFGVFFGTGLLSSFIQGGLAISPLPMLGCIAAFTALGTGIGFLASAVGVSPPKKG